MDFQLLKTARGDEDVRGWWLSEKLDGWRAAWIAKDRHFVTRGGRIITPPEWFSMPDVDLDGELWAGRGNLGVVQSLFGRCPRWDVIKFYQFSKLEFGKQFCLLQTPLATEHCKGVPNIKTTSWRIIAYYYANIIRNGGEGVVIRDPYAVIQPGRSDRVLKIKPPPFREGDPTVWTATRANEFLKLANTR